MQLKTFNYFLIGASILAIIGLLVVVNSFDPQKDGLLPVVFFCLTLFLAILGLMSLALFWGRQFIFKQREHLDKLASQSFRQAIIMATGFIIALLLQKNAILHWWVLMLLILTATFCEFLFLLFSQDESLNKHKY